jgi:hypothetical protein
MVCLGLILIGFLAFSACIVTVRRFTIGRIIRSEASLSDVSAKVFEKRVRSHLRRSGWRVQDCPPLSSFMITRGLFKIHILLGPRIYDSNFTPLGSVFSASIQAIRKLTGQQTLNIVVIVQDVSTTWFYEEGTRSNVAYVTWDKLSYFESFSVDQLTSKARNEGIEWATGVIKMNSQVCRRIARQAIGKGDKASALRWAEDAVEADPLDSLSHHVLASSRLAMGDLEGAAEAAMRAVEISSSSILLTELSEIELKRGNLDRALRIAERAVAADDYRAYDYYHLARVHMRRSELDLAERAAKQAVVLGPESPAFKVRLARVHSLQLAAGHQINKSASGPTQIAG